MKKIIRKLNKCEERLMDKGESLSEERFLVKLELLYNLVFGMV